MTDEREPAYAVLETYLPDARKHALHDAIVIVTSRLEEERDALLEMCKDTAGELRLIRSRDGAVYDPTIIARLEAAIAAAEPPAASESVPGDEDDDWYDLGGWYDLDDGYDYDV